jgi:hypothetical protein
MKRDLHVRICGGRRLRCRRLPGVVSDEEKARVTRQVGIRKASESEPFDDVSKQSADIETEATF